MTQPPERSVHPLSREEWRAWLREHCRDIEGVWLITYKKATSKPRISYDEAVEDALCFGWIDSVPRKLDEERSLLWFAPRKAKTGWSKLNKERVARLIAEGLVESPRLAKVTVAQQDGSWNALDAVESLEIPEDLESALRIYPSAWQNFAAFPRSAKRGILEWIHTAKRPETRAKRIAETAGLAEQNQRANSWRPKK